MSYDVAVSAEKYELIVQHLKEIVQPKGAWNNELEVYLTNVVKSCIEHAESILDLLGEEYQSLSTKARSEDV